MKKFEYKDESFYCRDTFALIYQLNKHGAEGWELVSCVPGKPESDGYTDYVCIFKREIQQSTD